MKDLSKKGSANEAVSSSANGTVISEAKLTPKEEEIEDPDELKKIIEKWQKHIEGTAKIKRKNGKFWSKKYANAKIELLNDRIKDLEDEDNDEEEDEEEEENDTSNSSSENTSTDNSSEESEESTGEGEEKVCAMINIDSEKINESVKDAESVCEDDKAIEEVGEGVTTVVAPDAANGEGEAEEGEEQPKKQGLMDKLGNAMKKGIQKVAGAVKGWWKKQGKLVKYLILAILAVMAVFAAWWLISSVIIPFVYGIMAQVAANPLNIIKIAMVVARSN